MSATIELDGIYGASPGTAQSVNQVNRRYTTDDFAPDDNTTVNPLILPSSSFYYSYWKTYRLNCTASPVGTVSNLRFYMDTSLFPSNYSMLGQLANVGADAGYRQASGTPGVTGLLLNAANHTGLIADPVDPFTWTAASPLALTGSITSPSTGLFGDHIVMQIAIEAGAVASALSAQMPTVIWDET